jgi:hypothetical protein
MSRRKSVRDYRYYAVCGDKLQCVFSRSGNDLPRMIRELSARDDLAWWQIFHERLNGVEFHSTADLSFLAAESVPGRP